MQLRLYTIEPALQPFVKVICSMENQGKDNGLPPFRSLPDTCTELFISYIDSAPTVISGKSTATYQRSFLISRMSRFMDVQSPPISGLLTVCFYPGSAKHFFELPMNEIANDVIGLQDLWKGMITEIEDRVASAKTNEERVMILQHYLLKELNKNYKADKTIQYCLWQMNSTKGQLSIGNLSEDAGISNRQLLRRFNDQVGLSPKEFARITKFISSLTVLKQYPDMSLTEIAYESGYYDQAHFIHDFKEFSGYSPGQLLASTHCIY
jgi:AraC-like DNA-binding protein